MIDLNENEQVEFNLIDTRMNTKGGKIFWSENFPNLFLKNLIG